MPTNLASLFTKLLKRMSNVRLCSTNVADMWDSGSFLGQTFVKIKTITGRNTFKCPELALLDRITGDNTSL